MFDHGVTRPTTGWISTRTAGMRGRRRTVARWSRPICTSRGARTVRPTTRWAEPLELWSRILPQPIW